MSYDPHSNEWLLNRFDIYKDLRTQDTAYWSEKYQLHVITRYDDVFFALNNPKIFCSGRGNLLIEDSRRFGKTLGASDNPIHNDYKNVIKNAYSKDNIQRISKVFYEKAVEHLDNKTELNISEITDELCAWTVAEMLNLPGDKEKAKNAILDIHRYDPVINIVHPGKDLTQHYNIVYNSVKNKTPAPGPGVYHEYMNNNPKKLDSIFLLIANILAGPGSLGGALQYLTLDMYEEKQLDTLLNDRSLIPLAINESLRFRAATGRFCRTVTEEVTIHNVNLKPGDRVALSLESANRDPSKFENPDEFILTRDTTKHLTWGHGVHTCIALAISKELLTVYLQTLLDKVGKYEILTKPSDLKYTLITGGNINMMSNIMLRKL
jgi:cytochrome P450